MRGQLVPGYEKIGDHESFHLCRSHGLMESFCRNLTENLACWYVKTMHRLKTILKMKTAFLPCDIVRRQKAA